MPQKLLRYISAIWDAELKEGKKILSAPYFIVLRTGKKPHKGRFPKVSDLLPKGSDGKPLGKAIEIEYDVVDLPAWDFTKLIGGAVLRLTLGILHKMTSGNLDLCNTCEYGQRRDFFLIHFFETERNDFDQFAAQIINSFGKGVRSRQSRYCTDIHATFWVSFDATPFRRPQSTNRQNRKCYFDRWVAK